MRISFILLSLAICSQQIWAQELSYCQWKDILNDTERLIYELEENIYDIGSPDLIFEEKDIIISQSSSFFTNDAQIRSDIDPDKNNPPRVKVLNKLDPPFSYLNNINSFYDQVEIVFNNPKISDINLGRNLKDLNSNMH